MVLNGTDGGAVPGSRNNANTQTASFNISPNGKGFGYYVDVGYRVLPKLELDLRYDYLDRVKNIDPDEREFTNWTIGAQWFFNKKTRALLNYEIRDAKAPNFASSAPPNQIRTRPTTGSRPRSCWCSEAVYDGAKRPRRPPSRWQGQSRRLPVL